MKVQKMCIIAMLMAMAIALAVLESFIPSFSIPGIKFGFANIIILLTLYEFGILDALIVNLGRVFVANLVRGTIFQMGFFMSLTGALLSMVVMWVLIKCFKKLTPIAVSVVGAVFHITGQFIIAISFLGTVNILYYAPILLLVAVGSGILVGIVVILIRKTKVLENLKIKYQL